MIHVVATIEVKPGRRGDFLAEFQRVTPLVRAERGCIEYGPSVDLQTGISAQAPIRENVVVALEKWEGLDALRDHLASPHMAEYREKVRDFVAGVDLQVLEPV